MERQHVQQDVVRRSSAHASREQLLLLGEVRVRDDRALGLARRAARVELQRGVVSRGLGGDRGGARAGEERRRGSRSRRSGGRGTRRDPRGPADAITVRTCASAQKYAVSGGGMQRREDDEAAAGPQDAEHAREEVRARRDEHRDALALERAPSVEQRRGDAVGRGNRVAPRRLAASRRARSGAPRRSARASESGASRMPCRPSARTRREARAAAQVIRASAESGRRFMKKPSAVHGQRGT